MKSKHIAAYGEEIAHSNFRNYHIFDNFLYKSTITALLPRLRLL
ncbi:hypothetical protein [Hominilimicola sp.]